MMKTYITLLLSCLVLLVASSSVSARGNSPGKKESKIQLSKEILHVDAVVTESSNLLKYEAAIRSDHRSTDAYSTTKVKKEKEIIAKNTYALIKRRREEHRDYGRYLIDKPVAMSKQINAPPHYI